MSQPAPADEASNPMVEYINSLRTQLTAGNPSYVHETRQVFLSRLRTRWSWFPTDQDLHVQSRLDDLVRALVDKVIDVDLIFLTGDAGDGKTAICAQLKAALGDVLPLEPVVHFKEWMIVKDASEIAEEDLGKLIDQHLSGTSGGKRLIVAINEGRLRRVMRHRSPVWENVVAPAIDASLTEDGAKALDARMKEHRVLVVNFRHRFHVRPLLTPLLKTWTKPEYWEESHECTRCPASTTCPILGNVLSLRQPKAQESLADLLTALHFSGQRLPFRRLQALLALATTGGLHCPDVQGEKLRGEGAALERLRYRYYEAIFRKDASGPIQVQPELLGQALSPHDPGRLASRSFDDEVTAKLLSSSTAAGALQLAGEKLDATEQQAMTTLRRRLELGSENISSQVALLTRSLRRWSSLSGQWSPETAFWPRALKLLEDYARGNGDGKALREAVVSALNRLHRVNGTKADLITRHQVDPGGFRESPRLALEVDLGVEFETGLRKGPVLPPTMLAPWMEACPSDIFLDAWPQGQGNTHRATLQLDTRLVEALLAVTAGYRYFGTLGAYRRDLARFFSQLAGLAAQAGFKPKISLRLADHRVSVTSQGDKLRFDSEG
jgi:hypothetical protein